MCRCNRLLALAIALLGWGIVPPPAVQAAFYAFTGTITSVADPFGAFSGRAAVVGAPVSGTFGYSDTADYPNPFQFNPFVTGYSNRRGLRPEVTDLKLSINGVALRSAPFSLTNLQVGDNVPP